MAKLHIGFGVVAQWGEPENELSLVGRSPYRFKAGHLEWQQREYVNTIHRLYGLTCGSKWAFVFLRTARTKEGVVPAQEKKDTAQ